MIHVAIYRSATVGTLDVTGALLGVNTAQASAGWRSHGSLNCFVMLYKRYKGNFKGCLHYNWSTLIVSIKMRMWGHQSEHLTVQLYELTDTKNHWTRKLFLVALVLPVEAVRWHKSAHLQFRLPPKCNDDTQLMGLRTNLQHWLKLQLIICRSTQKTKQKKKKGMCRFCTVHFLKLLIFSTHVTLRKYQF